VTLLVKNQFPRQHAPGEVFKLQLLRVVRAPGVNRAAFLLPTRLVRPPIIPLLKGDDRRGGGEGADPATRISERLARGRSREMPKVMKVL